MENRRPRNHQIARCKKHPNHQQSPGVCSICLREKLSRLSTKRSKDTTLVSYCSSSSSSLSSLSSYHSSSESSPVHHLYRVRSDAKGSSFLRSSGKSYNVLGKSRSMAAPPRTREGEGREGKKDMKKKKKKSGFWSKLLRTRSSKKNDSGLGQSRDTREMVIAA